jgi:galactokinase
VPSLREATIESLNVVGLSDLQRRRALHVIAENTRTILAAEALVIGDFKRFGQFMFDSHASLRHLYEVSCAELDAVVETAMGMRDRDERVLGARMTGAGFGGCAIVLCEAAHIERVMRGLREAFVQRFNRPPASMFVTQAAGGARAMSWPC